MTSDLTTTLISQPSGEEHSFGTSFPKWREALFLSAVGGMSFLFGFGSAVSTAKKKDALAFDKGMTPVLKSESGVALASRGCGILFFCVWKMMGVKNLQEFRQKSGEMLPTIRKSDPPQSRTEFSSLNDLIQYVIDEDSKVKTRENCLTESCDKRIIMEDNN